MNDKTNPLQNFETEELLRFLEEGFLLTDLEGNILSLNNAGSSVFGYGNALELVGKNFRDLFWKTEDFGTFLDTIKKTGEIQEYLIFGRKRDGRPAYIQAYSRLHPVNAEKPEAIATLFKDVSERELFKRALERSEDRYRTLFNSISEGYVRFNADNQVVFINAAGAKILGFETPMAVLGQQIMDLWQDPMAWVDFKDRLTTRGELSGEHVELELRNGRRVTLEITERIVRNRDGQVVGSDALFKDITEQHALQERLVESAQKLHEIVSSCAEMMLVADTAGKITFVNNAYQAIFGYSVEDAVGKQLGYATFLEDRERLEAAMREVLQGRPVSSLDLRVFRKDGTEVMTSWSASALRDVAGRVKGIIAIGRDVTESRKAEYALRESERFLSSIFASIQDGISILDKDYKIVAVNPTMEKWYAHAMPLVGKKCYAAYHLRKEICAPCPSRSVLETGKASREIVPRIGEGRKITGWVDLFSFPMFDTTTGALKGVIEYVRDITERVEAEKRLQFMSRAIEQTTEGIGIADLNGNILFINRAAAAMAGYTAEELIGKNLSLLHNAEQIPATEAARKQVIETGEFTGEIWHIRRDGTPFLALMRNSLIRNEASQPFGVIATVRDITEAKRADTALRKEKEFSERLIENANNIILTLDLEGRITTFNRFAEELTGYSRSEVIGKNYFDTFIPEKERKEQVEGFRAFIKGSPPMTDLSTIVCKDGVKRVIMWTSSLLNTADGSITGSLSIGKDMTERPLADFRPREEHDFSKAMLDTSAALMLVADREGRVAKINEAMTKLTGFTEEEIKGRTLWETIIPRGNEKESRERYAALFREAKHALVERTILNKAGEVRYVIWCNDFIRNEAGNPCYMVSVGTDFTETMELRRRIERSEKMYQSVVDNSPDIILRADTSGKITFVGGGGRQLTGYADEDALGKSIGEFLHPADRKEVEAAFMRAASGEIVENVVGRAVTKNGGILHLSNSARAIRNERGEVAEVQITSRDISPLVRLQEQLRRHSEDLEELVEKRTIALRDALQKRAEEELYSAKLQQLAPLAFIGTDENMLIRTWNTPAEKMFGYATEEVIGKSPAILVAPEKMNDFNSHMAAGMRGETVRGFESVGITKDGRRIDVKLDLMALIDEKGRKIRGLGLVEDITQQKAAQRALEEARKRLQIVLEEIPEYGIFSTDANFVITYFGPGCENLTGWKAHEVVGIKDAHILKPSAESTPRTRPLHEAFLSGAPASEPVTIMRKDGSTAEVSAVVKPILDKNGVAQGIIGVLRDISKERDLVGRLFEDARYKALGAIIAGISAELNGTLNRLEQHAALAKEDAGFAKRLSASVREEVRRTRALIGNLTRFTRPASQPFQLLNPAKVTDEVAQMLQGEFERAGVRMVKTYHHVADTLMRADDVQHALLNLILAAMTNAGKGGSVEIIVQQDDAIITLTVKDNGQGMEASDIYRAFEPPFWLEASTSRQEKGLSAGMGLGLISAKKTAEDHGGTVEIESESGVGTTVRIKLPVKTVRRGRKTTKIIAAAQPMPNQLPLRILVADDETHIRSVIAYIAKEKSHLCETATALAEVRNLCAERKFDVALIDEGLGSETDLAAAIAAVKGSSPKARVYLLTEGTAESAAGRLEHLVDGALTHTFSVEDIQRLLGR